MKIEANAPSSLRCSSGLCGAGAMVKKLTAQSGPGKTTF